MDLSDAGGRRLESLLSMGYAEAGSFRSMGCRTREEAGKPPFHVFFQSISWNTAQ